MRTAPGKPALIRAFSAAAPGYEQAAAAQARAARLLADRALERPRPPSPRVLEIGCGTGLLTRILLERLTGGAYLATDIAPGMVAAIEGAIADPRLIVREMDGEAPDPGEARFDLIVSNLAAQWFSDQEAAFARLAERLAPGGRLAATTLGAGSFAEWRCAHEALGQACGIPAYPTLHHARTWLEGRSLVCVDRFEECYADGRDFLNTLKALGAATPVGGHQPLKPGSMRRILDRLGRPCVMTYEVITLVFDAE